MIPNTLISAHDAFHEKKLTQYLNAFLIFIEDSKNSRNFYSLLQNFYIKYWKMLTISRRLDLFSIPVLINQSIFLEYITFVET